MNSEELELSLRSEFESYLNNFRAEMRDHAVELHRQVEAEMEKHRSLLDQAFQAYTARLSSGQGLDEGFRASVIEHLKQSRDAGAALTAAAMDDAAELGKTAAAAPPADYKVLRDAINDVSRQKSQATILKALVDQAANFAPRGAFFVIKGEQAIGWKVFGTENENVIREIHFPVSSDTIVGGAISSLTTIDGAYGSHAEDAVFLEPLNYGHPGRMHVIPLIARGRAVAVLYADYGTSGFNVNIEALEALVSIAGLTVELLAATQTAKVENREMGAADFEQARHEHAEQTQPEISSVRPEVSEPSFESRETDFAFTESTPSEKVSDATSPFGESVEAVSDPGTSPAEEATAFEPVADTETDQDAGEIIYDAVESPAPQTFVPSPFDSAAAFEPAGAGVGLGGKKTVDKAVEVSPANVGRATRADRHVDLPIEVTEEERRPHNDARRFARLLVSEIKLYNEQRVSEGRQAGDLYQRLREAIDRSREMYDKRVQPPVAAKFDYFHYEILNTLADGNAERLGSGYPGSSV